MEQLWRFELIFVLEHQGIGSIDETELDMDPIQSILFPL